jgi:hypothetical protein
VSHFEVAEAAPKVRLGSVRFQLHNSGVVLDGLVEPPLKIVVYGSVLIGLYEVRVQLEGFGEILDFLACPCIFKPASVIVHTILAPGCSNGKNQV